MNRPPEKKGPLGMGSLPTYQGFKLPGREGMSQAPDWMCLDVHELRIANGREGLTERRTI